MRPAGRYKHRDVGVVDESFGGVWSRLSDDSDEVVGSPCLDHRAIENVNEPCAEMTGSRMGAEDDGITGSQHSDGVADDCLSGIRRRRDGANDSVGGVFEGGQAVVALTCLHDEIFDTRGAGCRIEILENLVVGIAHPGLLDSSRGHVFQTFLLTGCFAHGIDEGTALRQGTVREGEEGLTGGSHCGVDVGEHSAELSAGGRDCCSGHGCWLLRVWSPGGDPPPCGGHQDI